MFVNPNCYAPIITCNLHLQKNCSLDLIASYTCFWEADMVEGGNHAESKSALHVSVASNCTYLSGPLAMKRGSESGRLWFGRNPFHCDHGNSYIPMFLWTLTNSALKDSTNGTVVVLAIQCLARSDKQLSVFALNANSLSITTYGTHHWMRTIRPNCLFCPMR